MTRIVAYNILAGGYSLRENGSRRTNQLARIIRSAQPDLVGLVEATFPQLTRRPFVIEDLAEQLGMQLVLGGELGEANDYEVALLTRLPVIHTRLHRRPGVLNKPFLEVCVEEENGEHLTVFVVHLSAAFNQKWAGEHIRRRETQELLRVTAPLREQGIPHVIMGDFNEMMPGDPFKASFLLRYVVRLDQHKKEKHISDGHPHMDFVVPGKLRFLIPILRIIPRSQLLSNIFDGLAGLYAPRGSMRRIQNAGYIDCYRHVHPQAWGFTCPASAPAGRIDYIFASPSLTERLETCDAISEGDGLPGDHASDHLAIAGEFGLRVQPEQPENMLDDALTR